MCPQSNEPPTDGQALPARLGWQRERPCEEQRASHCAVHVPGRFPTLTDVALDGVTGVAGTGW